MQINILEAKNQLSKLIQSALEGNDVVIANRGNPVVRLVPVAQPEQDEDARSFGEWLAENPMPEHLQSTASDIDCSIDEQQESWD